MRMINRTIRRWLLAGLIAVLAFAAAACSGGSSGGTSSGSTGGSSGGSGSGGQSQGQSQSAAGTSAEPVKISFLHWRTEDEPALREIIKRFEAEHPNVTVSMEIVPPENYVQTVKTRAISNEIIADVFYMHPGDLFITVAKAGRLLDLTDEPMTGRYHDNILPAGQYDGRQYGYPYTANYVGVIYNKGLLDRLGLTFPGTWEEFLEMCEKLKAAGIAPLANGAADGYPVRHAMYPILSQLAHQSSYGSVQNYIAAMMEGKIPVSDPVLQEGAEMFRILAEKGYYPMENLSSKYDQASALFAKEEAAILMTGSWAMSSVLQQNPNIELGLATIPLRSGPAYGINMIGLIVGIDSTSKHQAEAKAFLDFLSSPEIAKLHQEMTLIPTLIKGIESDDKLLKLISEKMANAVPAMSDFSTKQAYMDAIGDLMARVLSGQSLQEATGEVQKRFDSIAKE